MVNYSILNLPSILDIYWPCLILIILSCFFFTLILKSNIAHVIWIIKEGTDNLTTNVSFFFYMLYNSVSSIWLLRFKYKIMLLVLC